MNLFSQLLSVRPELATEKPVVVGIKRVCLATEFSQVVQVGNLTLDSHGEPVTDFYVFPEPELFEETFAQLAELVSA